MQFTVYEAGRDVVRSIRPLLLQIRRYDVDLDRQLKRAVNSIVLNIREGNHSSAGTRRARFESAMASASEVTGGLHAAVDWGYLTQPQTEAVEHDLDRVRAMLWRLIHPKH